VLRTTAVVQQSANYVKDESTLGFSELGGLALSVIALFRYLNIRAKYRDQVFNRFIRDNHWLHEESDRNNKIPDILLSAGGSHEQGDSFKGNFAGHTFTCFLCEFVAFDSQVRSYICMSFKLSRSYPTIIVGNKNNDHIFRQSEGDIAYRIPDGISMQLEGDFNSKFRVMTTKRDQKHTLEVLTPDILEIITDYTLYNIDVEIQGKDFYLMCASDSYSERNMKAIFDMSSRTLGKLDHLSKSWLASEKSEEKIIAQRAYETHEKLIFKVDYVSMAILIIMTILGVVLLLSNIFSVNHG
jgi:hypothetical protein